MNARPWALLLPLLLICSQDVESGAYKCRPTFREVSERQITPDLGYWELRFSVALIGCAGDLDSMTQRQLQAIRNELETPSEWSNLTLITRIYDVGFREQVAHRLNKILGEAVIYDVLFHDAELIDHNQAARSSTKHRASDLGSGVSSNQKISSSCSARNEGF